MEGKHFLKEVKELFGDNFIGPDELYGVVDKLPLQIPQIIPSLKYSYEELKVKSKDYLLVLTVPELSDGSKTTILKLREIFGVNPEDKEPCLYNQDWYLKEDFVKQPFSCDWLLLRKDVYENTRAQDPSIIESKYNLPTALQVCYTFFVVRLILGITLWKYDFIWCSDKDHNGDRIYVGKYFDIDGVNKNGFSIHRHLALRNCYASVDIY